MGELIKMLGNDVEQLDFAIYLNNLTHVERMKEILELKGKKLQERLYRIGKPVSDLKTLIPSTTSQEFIFHGLNSLSTFNRFQKRMCLSEDRQCIWGYNYQPMQWLTGPGYFIIGPNSDRGDELMMDYTKVPSEEIPRWPGLRSNHTGIAHLVYGNLKDFVRQISTHVFINEATKHGKNVGYFILCREDLN